MTSNKNRTIFDRIPLADVLDSIKGPIDFDLVISDQLEVLQNHIPTATPLTTPAKIVKCEYDPFETAKRVQKILSLPCVEAVFIPDIFVINHLSEHEGKIFYKSFKEDDRFAVSLKPECGKAIK